MTTTAKKSTGKKGMSSGWKSFGRMFAAVILGGLVLIVIQVTIGKKPIKQLSDKFPE